MTVFSRVLLILFVFFIAEGFCGYLHYPQEVNLKNVRQLTFAGANAEAYFSFNNKKIVFQAVDFGSKCDQIFEFNLTNIDMPSNHPPRIVSNGLGVCTCSFFMPDNQNIIFASTFKGGKSCPQKVCRSNEAKTNSTLQRLCNTTYTWDIFPTFDIYTADQKGNLTQLVTLPGYYDAEATVSPTKDKIVFTSTRSGDLELYTMNVDGSNVTQITNETGYDGGAFFSPDGKRLVYRASRPKNKTEIAKYNELLSYNLVSPTKMELYTINADGTNQKQITHLGGANWAPYWHPDGKRIIFSSNHDARKGGFNFNLFMVNDDGSNKRQITFDPVFDAFPMFSYDGKHLIFSSSRNAAKDGDINLFIAEWVETTSKSSPHIQAELKNNLGLTVVLIIMSFVLYA